MSTLLDRTRPEFYDEWAARAREAGASERAIREHITDSIKEAKALREGKCPRCGAPVKRYTGGPQHGMSHIPGVWVMYRCSTQPPPGRRRDPDGCAFMLDLKEEVAN